MKAKYITMGLRAILALPITAMMLQSCSEELPFYAASENDEPRILNSDLQSVSSDGSMMAFESINRTENFVYGVVATPRDYVTINWTFDGVDLHTGDSIDMPMLAGDYVVRITATTTKGKSTFRERSLTVKAVDGDPTLDGSEQARWFNPGNTVTISGTNLDGITALYVGGVNGQGATQAQGFVNNGTSLTFVVPELEGDLQITLANAEGQMWGCGRGHFSSDAYVAPGVEVKTLWSGQQFINWGETNVTIPAEAFADVPVGTVLKVNYNMPEAEYHQMRVTTPWWGDNAEDNIVQQFDLTAETPNPYEFVYDEHAQALIQERGGMLFVGFGYELTSVTYEMETVARETTLWTGPVAIDWNADLVKVTAEEMASVPEGATIRVYWSQDPGPGYCAFRITSPWWGDDYDEAANFVCRIDSYDEIATPFEFEWDARRIAMIQERGAMCVLGAGAIIEQITWSK